MCVIELAVKSTFSPDSDNLAPVEINPIHLGDKDGGHRLIKRRAVHVDRGAHREHEASDPLIDAQVLLQAAEGDRQGTGAVVNGKREKKVRLESGRKLGRNLQEMILFGTLEINQLDVTQCM